MSKEVKRYNFDVDKFGSPRAYESEHGRWMKRADYDALLAERDALKAAQPWVSVEEKLPEDGGEGLCALRLFGEVEGEVIVVPFRFIGGTWYPHHRDDDDVYSIDTALDGELYPPTHWMLLPAPPALQGDQQ